MIEEKNIKYQNDNVCILHPDCGKGILIFTKYSSSLTSEYVMNNGLKTGEQLKLEGIDFGRSICHPYIFFRAPYKHIDAGIDYSSPLKEIECLYDLFTTKNYLNFIWIRVDPDKTNVFSSEIRSKYIPLIKFNSPQYCSAVNYELNKSKKTLSMYLSVISDNEKKGPKKSYVYNLYTSKKEEKIKILYPYDTSIIQKNSEILVSIPHLTPDYFVNFNMY